MSGVVGEQMIVRDAAGELEVDHPIRDTRLGDEFADLGHQEQAERHAHLDAAGGLGEAVEVGLEGVCFAAVEADDLVDAVGELKAVVFDADAGVGKMQDFPLIQIKSLIRHL